MCTFRSVTKSRENNKYECCFTVHCYFIVLYEHGILCLGNIVLGGFVIGDINGVILSGRILSRGIMP